MMSLDVYTLPQRYSMSMDRQGRDYNHVMEEDSPAVHLGYEEVGLLAARGVLVLVDVLLCVCRPKQLLRTGCTCYMIRPGPCMSKEHLITLLWASAVVRSAFEGHQFESSFCATLTKAIECDEGATSRTRPVTALYVNRS